MDIVILNILIVHGIVSNAMPRTLSTGNRLNAMPVDMNLGRECRVQVVVRISMEIKPRIYFDMLRSNTVNIYMTYYFNVQVVTVFFK